MMPALLPDAEHALDVAVRRALALIREGRIEEAGHALMVGLAAAELMDAEREELRVREVADKLGPYGYSTGPLDPDEDGRSLEDHRTAD